MSLAGRGLTLSPSRVGVAKGCGSLRRACLNTGKSDGRAVAWAPPTDVSWACRILAPPSSGGEGVARCSSSNRPRSGRGSPAGRRGQECYCPIGKGRAWPRLRRLSFVCRVVLPCRPRLE
ncbi:hypothetical protein NDU88_001317 [Pleurodeles waltl]|uniref:Uncharacterized protein n=1 Tax=Pleurodeles waltl TaxID=8319 RepID=A0AAV7SZ64_PLEWA|nr:hypothetical protein NDU88_001317 [Pleurodeles waltl]